MPQTILEPIETTEEHLAEEIRELERPALASLRTWAMALAVFAALVLVVAAFMIWEASSIASMNARRAAEAPPVRIALQSLQQGLEFEPRVFRWGAVPGAANYVFIVRDAGASGEVALIRSMRDPLLTTTDVESANLGKGRFVWSVEARRADGSRVGYGEGTFAIE